MKLLPVGNKQVCDSQTLRDADSRLLLDTRPLALDFQVSPGTRIPSVKSNDDLRRIASLMVPSAYLVDAVPELPEVLLALAGTERHLRLRLAARQLMQQLPTFPMLRGLVRGAILSDRPGEALQDVLTGGSGGRGDALPASLAAPPRHVDTPSAVMNKLEIGADSPAAPAAAVGNGMHLARYQYLLECLLGLLLPQQTLLEQEDGGGNDAAQQEAGAVKSVFLAGPCLSALLDAHDSLTKALGTSQQSGGNTPRGIWMECSNTLLALLRELVLSKANAAAAAPAPGPRREGSPDSFEQEDEGPGPQATGAVAMGELPADVATRMGLMLLHTIATASPYARPSRSAQGSVAAAVRLTVDALKLLQARAVAPDAARMLARTRPLLLPLACSCWRRGRLSVGSALLTRAWRRCCEGLCCILSSRRSVPRRQGASPSSSWPAPAPPGSRRTWMQRGGTCWAC